MITISTAILNKIWAGMPRQVFSCIHRTVYRPISNGLQKTPSHIDSSNHTVVNKEFWLSRSVTAIVTVDKNLSFYIDQQMLRPSFTKCVFFAKNEEESPVNVSCDLWLCTYLVRWQQILKFSGHVTRKVSISVWLA